MKETTANQPENRTSVRIIAAHKAKLTACAAIIAVLGAGAALAGDKSNAPNSLTPVADLSASDQGQEAVPSFASLVERVKPAVVSVFVKAEKVDEVSDAQGQDDENPFQGSPFQFGPQSKPTSCRPRDRASLFPPTAI